MKRNSWKPEIAKPIKLGYLTKLFWMVMPYSHQRPLTRNVENIRGKGNTSVLCVRNTSVRETSGEAQKMMLPRQHIRPIRVLMFSVSSPARMKVT